MTDTLIVSEIHLTFFFLSPAMKIRTATMRTLPSAGSSHVSPHENVNFAVSIGWKFQFSFLSIFDLPRAVIHHRRSLISTRTNPNVQTVSKRELELLEWEKRRKLKRGVRVKSQKLKVKIDFIIFHPRRTFKFIKDFLGMTNDDPFISE